MDLYCLYLEKYSSDQIEAGYIYTNTLIQLYIATLTYLYMLYIEASLRITTGHSLSSNSFLSF